jgi:hypothetical protein
MTHIARVGVAMLAVVGALALGGCGGDDEPEEAREPATEPSEPAKGERTATSPTGQTSGLEVSVDPAKAGTEARPQGVTLEFNLRFGTTTEASPSPPSSLLVRATRGFTINGKAFPRCRRADLEANGPERCARAKVANGSAEVIAEKGKRVQSKLSVFNGVPERGQTPSYLFYVETPGFDPIVKVGQVKKLPRGPYGVEFEVPPAGGARPVTRMTYKTLDLTTTRTADGKQVETHFLEAPTSCSGLWKFDQRITFESGETVTTRVSVPCTS